MVQSGRAIAEPFDLKALTTALNRVFQPQGITAVSRYRTDCLQVALVGWQVPEPGTALAAVRTQLQSWGLTLKVIVIGRQIGQVIPAWAHTLELEAVPNSEPISASVVTESTPIPAANSELQDFVIFLCSLGLLLGLGWYFWLLFNYRPRVMALPPDPLSSWQASAKASDVLAKTNSFLSSNVRTPGVEPLISIKAVGDIVPGTNFLRNALPDRPQRLFQAVRPYLQGADILFGNFESTLTNYPYSAKDSSQAMVFAFRSPPSYAKLLKQEGFQVLSVANNHSYDFATTGFNDTVNAIRQAGMQSVGQKRQIVYSQVRGVTIAFIGFSYLDGHNRMQDLRTAIALVQQARQRADIVVISVHAGAEGSDALRVSNRTEMFYGEDRGNQVLFARTMIDHGADLVLGHGPHVPRAMELYQGKLIVYSLGNFVGYHTLSTTGVLGVSFVLEAQLNRQGQFVQGRILPVYLDAQGIPRPDVKGRSIQLIRSLTQADFPGTPLKIDSLGRLSR